MANHPIPVGRRPQIAAVEQATDLTAHGAGGEHIKVQAPQQTSHGDIGLGRLVPVDGEDPHTAEYAELIESQQVCLVSGEPVETFGKNDVELSSTEILEKLLVAGTIQNSA